VATYQIGPKWTSAADRASAAARSAATHLKTNRSKELDEQKV